MIGSQDHKIARSSGGLKPREVFVKAHQTVGVSSGIATMAIEHVEVDEIRENQTTLSAGLVHHLKSGFLAGFVAAGVI
jgi:hypothetical protein